MSPVRRLIFFAAAAAVMTSCTTPLDPRDDFPTFYGKWAGQDWRGDAEAILVGDTLVILASGPLSPRLSVQEGIVAKIPVNGTGVYLLGPGAVQFNELVGGDVLAATYVTTDSSVGRLTLTSYRGVGSTAEGTIEFDAETTSPYGSYGRKASMRQGFFTAVVRATQR